MLNQYVHFHKIHRIFVCTLESETHQTRGNYAVDSLSLEAKGKQLCAHPHACTHTHTHTHTHTLGPQNGTTKGHPVLAWTTHRLVPSTLPSLIPPLHHPSHGLGSMTHHPKSRTGAEKPHTLLSQKDDQMIIIFHSINVMNHIYWFACVEIIFASQGWTPLDRGVYKSL